MIPLTCGRTSAIRSAAVRPVSSVVSWRGAVFRVTTSTAAGGMAPGPPGWAWPQAVNRLAASSVSGREREIIFLCMDVMASLSKKAIERHLAATDNLALRQGEANVHTFTDVCK